jgi:hypothetical protein
MTDDGTERTEGRTAKLPFVRWDYVGLSGTGDGGLMVLGAARVKKMVRLGSIWCDQVRLGPTSLGSFSKC